MKVKIKPIIAVAIMAVLIAENDILFIINPSRIIEAGIILRPSQPSISHNPKHEVTRLNVEAAKVPQILLRGFMTD